MKRSWPRRRKRAVQIRPAAAGRARSGVPKKKTLNATRLETRIHPELRALIQRAADLQGRTLTDFVTTALQVAAQRAVAESRVMRLAAADQLRFARALIAPTSALKRAFSRRRTLAAGA